MENEQKELLDYVCSKSGSWATSTSRTAHAKLNTVIRLGMEPTKLYTELSRKFTRYTVLSYFILARDFEKSVKKTNQIEQWMQSNRIKFKGSYKEKTKKITTEQFNRYTQLAPSDNCYNFLMLIGVAGLRLSEALSIKWEDIQGTRLCVMNGKGDKQRFIPIQSDLLKSIKTSGFIIPKGFRYAKFIKENCEGFTPHDFRAYAITSWIERGLHLKEAALLAGHERIMTTEKYVRTDLNQIERKLGL